jgi:hypothetical protein
VMARLRSSSSSGSAATSLAMAMATVPTMMCCVCELQWWEQQEESV